MAPRDKIPGLVKKKSEKKKRLNREIHGDLVVESFNMSVDVFDFIDKEANDLFAYRSYALDYIIRNYQDIRYDDIDIKKVIWNAFRFSYQNYVNLINSADGMFDQNWRVFAEAFSGETHTMTTLLKISQDEAARRAVDMLDYVAEVNDVIQARIAADRDHELKQALLQAELDKFAENFPMAGSRDVIVKTQIDPRILVLLQEDRSVVMEWILDRMER